MAAKVTTVRFDEEDAKAIETIKARYGISTDSDALRFALRIVAQSDVQLVTRRKKDASREK